MIEVGDYARYVNTGTVGKVMEISEFDGKKFALLDGTDLYYDIDYLEKAERPAERKDIKMDLETQRRIQEQMVDALQSGEMSENTGGG